MSGEIAFVSGNTVGWIARERWAETDAKTLSMKPSGPAAQAILETGIVTTPAMGTRLG